MEGSPGPVKANSEQGVLFVCTKPYQYLIARLIKEGCGFACCDLVVLNHFWDAADFARKVEETGVWNRVMFIDDGQIDQFKHSLHPLRKYFFYHNWPKLLPAELQDISGYEEVFVAHDFVAMEYAVIRKFSSERKRVNLYEEGFGNYINNSTHTRWHMRLLKWAAPWFGLPGGYFGSLKWVDAVWLQRPSLVTTNRRNPIRRKTRGLPLPFDQFLGLPAVIRECDHLYPELREIDRQIAGHDAIAVVLTDPFLDAVPERRQYLRVIRKKVYETLGNRDVPLFFKQHPGERRSVEEDGCGLTLPRKLPGELLYVVMRRNGIRKIHLFSFGSTVILNLYDLCKQDNSLDIYIFDSLAGNRDVRMIADRFCSLAAKHQIAFQYV
jgi:hypothetical protein